MKKRLLCSCAIAVTMIGAYSGTANAYDYSRYPGYDNALNSYFKIGYNDNQALEKSLLESWSSILTSSILMTMPGGYTGFGDWRENNILAPQSYHLQNAIRPASNDDPNPPEEGGSAPEEGGDAPAEGGSSIVTDAQFQEFLASDYFTKSFLNYTSQINDPELYAKAAELFKSFIPDLTNKELATIKTIVTNLFYEFSHINKGNRKSAATGDTYDGISLWANASMTSTNFDGLSGFDGDTTTLTIGMEKNFDNKSNVGVAYSYSYSDISGAGRSSDVDTNTILVFGEYQPNNWYASGILGFSFNQTSDESSNGAININSDYDSNTVSAQIAAGYDYQTSDGLLNPEIGFRLLNIDHDDYTDSAGQHISSKSDAIFTAVVGLNYENSFKIAEGINLRPEFGVGLTYDLNEANTITYVGLGGTGYTILPEELARFGTEVNATLNIETSENIDFSIGYHGAFRKDYQAHTGMIEIKYNF